jgi:hypothetical protein
MQWTAPDFEEIRMDAELSAYQTDDVPSNDPVVSPDLAPAE